MATLPEDSNFDAGVYEIATTDLVLGGPSGPANAGPQNLTNRTRWLFDQNTATQAALAALNTDVATIDGEIGVIQGQVTAINASITSINNQLPLLAPIANPNFSGTPTAPTPGGFVNNSQIATTAYVFNWYAPKNSPAFSGVPTAPTAALGNATSQLATTAFVNPGTSIGTNGYRKNPDGTIEQWGFANPAAGGVTIIFPTLFPNACFNVGALSIAGGAVQTWLGSNPNQATFNLHNTGGTSFWTAKGN
jgi:hypothetical protein